MEIKYKSVIKACTFYSEDISKPEDIVEEFQSFRTLHSDLSIDLKTDCLSFLIAKDMDQAYPQCYFHTFAEGAGS